MSLFNELKRRNVFRVAIAYLISAWLLIQLADILIPMLTLPEWVSRLILLLLLILFIPTLILAWAFELTPEGLKREKDIDRSQSITHTTGRRLDFIIIGVLAVAVAWLTLDKVGTDTPPESEETIAEVIDESPSIAVLPFVNMSSDADSAYFSDGLADTLLHMLAQIKELRVAARTSSFQFRDKSMDVADIGAQLNVSTLLEGSVQRSGNKIRVTAQLIDVSNGFHLWSGNFDRELDDVFAIQDEIAAEVVSALKLSLLGASVETMQVHATESVEAYTQYLLALSDYNEETYESLTSAAIHLREAIEIDSNYAPAYSYLAATYYAMLSTGAISLEEAVPDIYAAATRALELSPNSPMSLASLGLVEMANGNTEVAEDLLLKAIQIGPNNTFAMQKYAAFLLRESRYEESIAVVQQVVRRDPLSVAAHSLLSINLSYLRRFDEAVVVANRIIAINSDTPYGYARLAYASQARGRWAEAIQYWIQAAALDPNDPELAVFVGDLYLSLGLPAEAGQWYDRAAEINPDHPVSLSRPLLLNWILNADDRDTVRQARKLLEAKIENRWGSRGIPAFILLDNANRTGKYSTLLETLDNLHPGLFDEPPVDIADDLGMTHLVGRALVQSGDAERGFHLLNAWSNENARFEAAIGVSVESIEIDLLRGDKQAALEKLRQRDSMKYEFALGRFLFARDSLWQTLADEPQFIEFVEDLDQHAEEQRILLQALEAQE